MATTLLLKTDDLTRNTILGGNIDVDRYQCLQEILKQFIPIYT